MQFTPKIMAKKHRIHAFILYFTYVIIALAANISHNEASPDVLPKNISAVDAYHKQQAGQLEIFDIRSIDEWHSTGVATNANLITMHNPNGPLAFHNSIKMSVKGNLDQPIALICASGYRSSWAQKFLLAKGFTNITNIEEGMSGRGNKIGWIGNKLPLTMLPKPPN